MFPIITRTMTVKTVNLLLKNNPSKVIIHKVESSLKKNKLTTIYLDHIASLVVTMCF